ncbi:calcium-dependent protein kinase 21 [Lysobacter capsici]|uniref:calcium-dependent protein kinase 21 n=1 Tax=Lysobacter capsici TaxID=435897 RepID=UPI001BFFF536|nr:calcium-dependent protein kinase 21 [Lysobacter capsici]QWF16832.1 calcium-dependent protein kinase 21 [Lysobacter capsici]
MPYRPLAFALCLLPAAVAAQVAAPAAGPVTSTGDYLSRMDADGDGRISLIEYQDWLSYAFDAMDANHDGVLDAQEQPRSGRGAHAALTREQHRLTLAERFRKQDRNHDGWLDARELASPPQ